VDLDDVRDLAETIALHHSEWQMDVAYHAVHARHADQDRNSLHFYATRSIPDAISHD